MPQQQVVLVTGASGGIGQAIAERFARDGARVALHAYRNRGAAEALLATLPGDGHGVVVGDLTDPAAANALMDEVIRRFGRIDVLVNNAGVAERHPPLEVDFVAWQEIWQRIVATNLTAPAHLCYLASRRMVAQGGGRIINISSRGAFRGEPEMPAYGASKAGLNALSQSLAKALAPHGVYVYVVAPGWVSTEMSAPRRAAAAEAIARDYPMGRVTTPEEVAHTVAFLASEGTASLTGAILDVNGASYLR